MNRNFNVCKMYNVIIAVIEWYNIETNYMDIKSLLLLQTIVLNSANADFLFGKNENVQKLENSWWRELHFEFHNVSQKLLGKLWCFHNRITMLRIEIRYCFIFQLKVILKNWFWVWIPSRAQNLFVFLTYFYFNII